ncbi:MAG: carboxypeptidase regulatory-like domain-containing protein [Thermodesulfovibrionia bacterium]|nr:carboxypeptidase regulatory-like domain-containing protein [Thermodesulfovibrionia bacterium]
MVRFFVVVLSIILCAVSAGTAQGYEVVKVKNGATLKGTVNFKGVVPPDETIVINKNVDYCGRKQKVGKYLVTDSRVKNVVVWIKVIRKGKATPQKSVDVTIKKCRAVPHVNIGFVGGEYIFRNDDQILHTVQPKLGLAYQKRVSRRPLKDGATIYNLALPKRGLGVKKPIKKWHRYTEETGLIQVMSNTHNWIRGYIFIFDHPYAAVTDEKGIFEIDNLPPGEYLLKAWHEGFGMQEKKIRVKSGEAVDVEIAFSK